MTRTRRAAAVICIALIVATAFMPPGGVSLDWLVVTPTFVLLFPFDPVPSLRADVEHDEQPLALVALLESRGPPVPSLA